MRLRKFLLLLLVVVVAQEGAAQSGIRFVGAQVDQTYDDDGFPVCLFGLGYDHDFNDRLGVSIEFTVPWRTMLALDPAESETPLTYAGWEGYWNDDQGGFGLLYRSNYFFGDNTDGSGYVSMCVGLRRLSRDILITAQYDGSVTGGSGPFRSAYSGERMVFPIGLRLGHRSALDGAYQDYYLGVGYLIGGGDNLFTEAPLQQAPTTLSSLTWTLGYALGIGW